MTKIKSEIAPKGMEFKPTEFMLGGKYSTILTVISFPKNIAPGFLSDITNIQGVKIAIKHIPIQFSVLQKMLNKEIADLKTRYQSEKDQTMQERIRQDYESLEQFIQMLAATQARIFDFQMHLMITADNKEELELRKIQVRSYLDALGMRAIALMFEQEKALSLFFQYSHLKILKIELVHQYHQLLWLLCIHLYLIVLKTLEVQLFLVLIFLAVLFYLINFYIK